MLLVDLQHRLGYGCELVHNYFLVECLNFLIEVRAPEMDGDVGEVGLELTMRLWEWLANVSESFLHHGVVFSNVT